MQTYAHIHQVAMHACMYVCMCTSLHSQYIYKHTFTCRPMHTCIKLPLIVCSFREHTSIQTYIHIQASIHIHTHAYICIHASGCHVSSFTEHTSIQTYIHTHPSLYTHTYTCTHMHAYIRWPCVSI